MSPTNPTPPSELTLRDPRWMVRMMTVADLPAVAVIEARVHLEPWSEAQILALPLPAVDTATTDPVEVDQIEPMSYFGVVCEPVQGFEIAGAEHGEVKTGLIGYVLARAGWAECEILSVGVDLPFQGQGVGQALIQAFVRQAHAGWLRQQAKSALTGSMSDTPPAPYRVCLEVRVGNAQAVRVYEKAGFVVEGRRKGFYRAMVMADGRTIAGDDAWVMCW